MGPDDSAVDDQVLHVGVIDQVLMHSLPNSALAPSGEPLVNAVPSSVLGREHPPLRTGTGNPQHGIDKPSTLSFLAYVQVCLVPEELANLRPLLGR